MEHRSNRQAEAVVSAKPNNFARDILIVDDHPLMCEALSATFAHVFDQPRIRSVASFGAAEKSLTEAGLPDAVVLDLTLPDIKGVEGVMRLRNRLPNVPLTVISAEVDPAMVAASMAAGASGFIAKSMPRASLIEAFRRQWQGETVLPEGLDIDGEACAESVALARNFSSLTRQQMNILRLICQGRPNKIISYELSIAEATVKTHIAAIMSKINVQNRTQAALLANKVRLFSR